MANNSNPPIAYEPVVQLLEDACESLPSAVGPAAVG